MPSKINPRRRPVSQADVDRAKAQARDEVIGAAMTIFLTVLVDKECADKDTIRRVWDEVNDLSDGIAQGYVSLPDLRRTLDQEYDIRI